MPSLCDALSWRGFTVGSGAATGEITVHLGEAGTCRPRALLIAGIHGDEGPWGACAIRRFLDRVDSSRLTGSLMTIPQANPLAMEADRRNCPLDSLDLNRVFPGDEHGSHTERLAHAIITNTLKDVDLVVDLHGGGSWCVNAFVFSFPGSEELARAVGAPFIVPRGIGPVRAGTPLTEYALSRGVRAVAIEMGGRSPDEQLWAARIAGGIERVLELAGALSPGLQERPLPSLEIGRQSVLRPSTGGVLMPVVKEGAAGTLVDRGTELGRLVHPATMQTMEVFTAPYAPTALMLLRPRLTVLEAGAMTYVVGEPKC